MGPDLVSRVLEMDPSLHFSTYGDNRVDPSNVDIGVVPATTSSTPKLEWRERYSKKMNRVVLVYIFCTFS